jgi:hypothetical protein
MPLSVARKALVSEDASIGAEIVGTTALRFSDRLKDAAALPFVYRLQAI